MKPRREGWIDLEWQLRNWAYFTCHSGDVIVEQAVHNVDKMCWTFNDADPIAAIGTGGRQQRIEPEYGQTWDHFSVTYEFPNGARGQISCRQQAGCYSEVRDSYYGTEGQVEQVSGSNNSIRDAKGEITWKYKGARNDMYQTEHDEFFASIRAGARPLTIRSWSRTPRWSRSSVAWRPTPESASPGKMRSCRRKNSGPPRNSTGT